MKNLIVLCVAFCLVACGQKKPDDPLVTKVEFPDDLNLDIVERHAKWFPDGTTIVVRLAVQPLAQSMRLFDPSIPDEELRTYVMERDESFRLALGEKMKSRIGFDLMEAKNIVYAATEDGSQWVMVAEGVASKPTTAVQEIGGLRCFALQDDFEAWGVSMKDTMVIATNREVLETVIAGRKKRGKLPDHGKRLISLSGKAPFSISAWGIEDPKNELPDAFGFSFDRGGYYRAEVYGDPKDLNKIQEEFTKAFEKYSGMANDQLESVGAEASNSDIVVDHLTETFIGATRIDRIDDKTIRVRGVLPEALTGLGEFAFFMVVLSLSSDSFVDYLKNAKADEGDDFTEEVAEEIKKGFEASCQDPKATPWTFPTLPDGKNKVKNNYDTPEWNAVGKSGVQEQYLRYRIFREEGELERWCVQGEVNMKPGPPHHVVTRCVSKVYEPNNICSATMDWSEKVTDEYE